MFRDDGQSHIAEMVLTDKLSQEIEDNAFHNRLIWEATCLEQSVTIVSATFD
jgi:hypothetical protein